jgi:transcriptional antiterminator RfaH
MLIAIAEVETSGFSLLPLLMDIWQQTNWFAIQTKPSRENFAATSVKALRIECFLPKVRTERYTHGISQIVIKPLFSGYLFARFCPARCMDLVRCARGVLRVLCSGRFPIPLEDDVILDIQSRLADDGFIRFVTQPLQPGDRIAVEQGPFQGLIGTVERETDDGKRVTLLLEAIHHARILIEKRLLAVRTCVG